MFLYVRGHNWGLKALPPMMRRRRRPTYNGVWGGAPMKSRGKAPGRGSEGQSVPEVGN